MLKKLFPIALLLIILCCSFSFPKFNRDKNVYAFGVSTSFTDSVIYFTNVQVLDSGVVKNKILNNRSAYSYQLKDYFDAKNMSNRVNLIYYSNDKEELEKKMNKISAKYLKEKHMSYQVIDPKDFSFKKVSK